jgi:Outer membrane protein beta-barrel domain
MQRRISSLVAVLAAALPFASQADTMDYAHVEAGYVDTELDVGEKFDGNGIELRGSIPFLDNFFAFASYQDLSFDFDVDATAIEVGAGGHWPLRDKMDIIGRVAIVQSDVEVGRFSADDDGFLLGARLRTEVAPKFELEGGFDYVDLDDRGDDTSVVLEGRYFFMNQLAGGLLLQFGGDTTTIGVSARVTF